MDNLPILVAVCVVIGTAAAFFLLSSKKKKGPPTVFPLNDFQKFPLMKKEKLSHDVCRFTFELPEGHSLGLPTGQHISVRFKDPKDGKYVQRSYTPVTDNDDIGLVSIVVKIYHANVHPKFPEGGKMSQYLDSLNVGDMADIKGPKGHMEYFGNGGRFDVKPLGKPKQSRQTNQIIMIAGGTGITPMLQILNYIFKRPADPSVKVKLLFANQTEEDILVRDDLEALEKEFPDRFQLHYTLDRPPTSGEWKYSSGFINKEMVEQHCLFPSGAKHTQVFMCGPPPMIKFACQPALTELGFTPNDMVVF